MGRKTNWLYENLNGVTGTSNTSRYEKRSSYEPDSKPSYTGESIGLIDEKLEDIIGPIAVGIGGIATPIVVYFFWVDSIFFAVIFAIPGVFIGMILSLLVMMLMALFPKFRKK